jgi:hypothetical protein
LYYSIRAFYEARSAKEKAADAARKAGDAGKSVKLQTMTADLPEVYPKLERLVPGVLFATAWEIYSDVSRRLLRAITSIEKEPVLSPAIANVRQALMATKESLKSVQPTDPGKEAEAPNAVYNALLDDFWSISSSVAELLGLIDNQTQNLGDKNVNASRESRI